MPAKGWWGMSCWNALSAEQQAMLIEGGVLPFGYWEARGGTCENGAQVAIECEDDAAPGARFYCLPCARAYLAERSWYAPDH